MNLFLFVLSTNLCVAFCLVDANRSRSRKLEACSPYDYRFEFTDCDVDGGRWRVAVPTNSECEDTIPAIPPKRLAECFISCEAGQFLNFTSLHCEKCGAGTYSTGGGVVFQTWDPLPSGFKAEVEKFRSAFTSLGRQYSNVNCSSWGWKTRKDMILSQGGPCVASLIYTAQLVKPGKLKFTYQYSDDNLIFQFQANSDQCASLQEAEGSRWPQVTGDGIWRTEEIPLRTGLNIFEWKTMSIDGSRRPKPLLIKRIEIEGVGYTSSCNPCPGGTYNNDTASSTCSLCPRDTYSPTESRKCIPCDTSRYYSDPGSDKCKLKTSCSELDYYQVYEPCFNEKTRASYKWVEPKICLEEDGAEDLPPPGKFESCPPCNAGMEYRNGTCEVCRSDEFSDGRMACIKCPPDSQPSRGHYFTQWYFWPANVNTTCITPEDTGCTKAPPWELHGDYVESGKGHKEWVYLVMTMSVAGFNGFGKSLNGELHEVGRVTFTFEMACTFDCELLFMQGTNRKNATIIERWIGSHAKTEFSQPIYRNNAHDFSWAFQIVPWDTTVEEQDEIVAANKNNYQHAKKQENYVRIYQITVTNTIDGGATTCNPCNSMSSDLCNPCQPQLLSTSSLEGFSISRDADGAYDKKLTGAQCRPCPPGSIRVDPLSSDPNNCRPCGPGLITKDGFECTTDCTVQKGHLAYDLRPLKGFYTVKGNSLFTPSGTQYFHMYNISFCMETYAICEKNVSLQHGAENLSWLEALICQSTIFPPTLSRAVVDTNYGVDSYSDVALKPLATHVTSLGDHLVGISSNPTILAIPAVKDTLDQVHHPHQFHFFYYIPERTIACENGRSTTITFRCKLPSTSWSMFTNNGSSALEREGPKPIEGCFDGTCDGCNFHFIWETPFACHLCSEKELTIVKGECKNGMQDLHYLPSLKNQCLLKINSSWPKWQKCQTHLPFIWELGIQIAGGLAVLLTLILICFWRRHRKLEYKYMKLQLVASSTSRTEMQDGKEVQLSERDMMPVAESCALDNDDDEEEDIYDREQPSASTHGFSHHEVSYRTEGAIRNFVSRIAIFDRFKDLNYKREAGSSLEIMNLTDKEACS